MRLENPVVSNIHKYMLSCLVDIAEIRVLLVSEILEG